MSLIGTSTPDSVENTKQQIGNSSSKKAKIANSLNLVPPICPSAFGEQHEMSILNLVKKEMLFPDECLAAEILAHSFLRVILFHQLFHVSYLKYS